VPFRSKKQRAYLYANEPEIAKSWAKKHGNKIVKKNTGGYIEIQPKGFGRMLPNKRPTTKIYT
jgi:hypothetical protein|tara:strand:+ start:637 stop:825 length:189 start_codon:yes stop_codon:yes gene_type:complete